MPRVLASADIGSNTVHLLVAETDGIRVRRLANRSEWLALGEAVARTHEISEDQASELCKILNDYRQIAAANRSEEFYVFATEAVRSAANYPDVLDRIQRETKMTVDVIAPAQEAEWSYRGSRLDSDLGPNLLLFEVGGGSVQVGNVEDYAIRESLSLPMGTGRIVAETGIQSPCPVETLEETRRFIRETMAPWRISESEVGRPVVASGGVVRGLWRAVHPDGDRTLAMREIQYVGWAAARLPVPAIASRFACKLKRAATLLPGAVLYEELLRHAGASELVVSEFGVREGAVLAMFEGSAGLCRV